MCQLRKNDFFLFQHRMLKIFAVAERFDQGGQDRRTGRRKAQIKYTGFIIAARLRQQFVPAKHS